MWDLSFFKKNPHPGQKRESKPLTLDMQGKAANP